MHIMWILGVEKELNTHSWWHKFPSWVQLNHCRRRGRIKMTPSMDPFDFSLFLHKYDLKLGTGCPIKQMR